MAALAVIFVPHPRPGVTDHVRLLLTARTRSAQGRRIFTCQAEVQVLIIVGCTNWRDQSRRAHFLCLMEVARETGHDERKDCKSPRNTHCPHTPKILLGGN